MKIDLQRRFEFLFREVYKEAKSLNLPIGKLKKLKRNSNFSHTLGCCINTGDGFIIEISDLLLLDACDHDVKQTMHHELIHTFPKCQNHGKNFKHYAEILNKRYGYNIQRANHIEWITGSYFKYAIQCNGCGKTIYYQKMCDAVRNPSKAICNKCHGQFTRIR